MSRRTSRGKKRKKIIRGPSSLSYCGLDTERKREGLKPIGKGKEKRRKG